MVKLRPYGLRGAALALCVASWLASAAGAADINACGQTVAAGETGVLVADLDCSSAPVGVWLLRDAVLDLNGHSITVGDFSYGAVAGVRRTGGSNPVGRGRGEFTILGPGVIEGTSYPPQTAIGTEACVLANNGRVAIGDGTSTVELRGCIYGVRGAPIFKGNGAPWSRGSEGKAQLQLNGVMLALNTVGTAARTVTATDVTATDNHSMGISADRVVTLQNVTATGNGIGVFAGELLTGANVTANGNTLNGVDTCGFGHIELTNLTANNNETFGACGDTVALTDSTALNNGYADVAALVAIPTLTNTTCGTSMKQDSSSWGVCAAD